MAYVNAQQQEAAQQMEQQGHGQAVGGSSSPRPLAAPKNHKLVAPERGQKPPMPPMRGAAKGTAQDALAFFGGGYQTR